MEKRLTKLTWITVIVVLLFVIRIKYQLTTTGSGEWNATAEKSAESPIVETL